MTSSPCYVGIDLGTTFSSLAYVDASGRVETLRLPDGTFQLASAVYFKGPSEVIIGTEALDYSLLASARVARAFKRHLGDPAFHFEADGRTYRPEELSAMVLKKLLAAAAERLGPIEHAVVSVPFVFDERRRQATQAAAQIAGLRSIDLIDEPVAAALAYGHTLIQGGKFFSVADVYADETVLIYDLGGGTFDATIMRLSQDGSFQVVATDGDERLGGEDWDLCLLKIISERYQQRRRINPAADPEFEQELRLKAVEVKKTLSERPRVEVEVCYQGRGDTHAQFTLTRGEFEKATAPLLARTEHTLTEMLERKEMSWNHIDRILMVGGSSRMPMVRKMLEQVTARLLDMSLPPDTAIAQGAALYAAHRLGKQDRVVKEVRTVNSHPLGLVVRSPTTGALYNDVLLATNEPTLTRVSRQYRIRRNKPITLRILLGDDSDPESCLQLGRGLLKGLPADLSPDDLVEVAFCFQQNGLLQVEGRLRRADGSAAAGVLFEVVVEGKMSPDEVEISQTTLRGISIE